MYEMEFEFKETKTRVDAAVKTTQGYICIDSKFPMTHYTRMTDKTLTDDERKTSEKDFKM